MYPKPQAKV